MPLSHIAKNQAVKSRITMQAASLDIWDKKYRLKTKEGDPVDQTISDTLQRVAKELAAVEPKDQDYWQEHFLWALENGAIPAGRILSNAGATAYKPSTSTINCTVSGTVGDSMDDILAKVHEAGLTLKAGCGIGYCFSTLRPKGAFVHGAGATTSGPLSFMDIFDKMCFTVSSAGGRRGAQMATFDVSHPDVMDFIKAKREDGRLRQFNLSLLITNEFIDAVKHDKAWDLVFPIQQGESQDNIIWRHWVDQPNLVRNDQGQAACRVYNTVKARHLWNLIMSSTYDFAEPGFILIDKVNDMNNNWFCENIRASNPCVTADTWVHTTQGIKQVNELVGKQFTALVDGKPHLSGPEGFFKTGTKPVVRLQTKCGLVLTLTLDHKLKRVVKGKEKWVAVFDLKRGDKLRINDSKGKQATTKFKRIAPAGNKDVYDVQIPGINTFIANKFHAHNCGEQMLPDYGSCLLGSVNLTQFILHPFTPQAKFDWEKYRDVVALFTRMLDNVVEINGLPLEQQRHEITHKRRHGMGFLGLGSALAMLGAPYGSVESVHFTEQVAREMALVGWQQALTLAKEKGPAPIMEQDFTVTAAMLTQRPEMADDGYTLGDTVKGKILHAKYSRYMQQLAAIDPKLVNDLAEQGARFTHHTSIAPTGTISLSLANNASNGIEPSFAHQYSRNIIREGRKTKEKVDVFSYEALAYRELTGNTDLLDTFVVADQVTPKQHVDIQAAAQKWVDSSISKTANVPTDFAFDAFKDIYLYAHQKGLKGCTTFRFNPAMMQGVLVKEQDLANTRYQFTLADGSSVELAGNETVEYDGEQHTAANLFEALKEGYYGKF